jgi:plastocyanin
MNHCHVALALFAMAAGLPSCSKTGTPTTPPASPATTAGSSTPAKESGIATAVSSDSPTESPGTPIEGPTGSIDGTVTFVGDEIPQSDVVPNQTDPQICGAAISKRNVEISPDTRGIRHVLVWLEGVTLPEGYRPPTQTLVLDNVKCQFEPHAAVITTGSTIETRNSDEVYHTTNLKGKVTKENIPLVAKGSKYETKVRAAELVLVSCDKHGWMEAFIRVDPHPFHAVTNADGKFSIAGVPVGTYKLRLFHGEFKGQEHEITVEENATATLEVKYPTEQK